ncbi:sigma-54-dependent Fis family transcriptional regulator [candidate division KSB1 bacterium]|nr:sigma-54-dependent Fis family transcriptional regulator [candidate division KSB1 bacterium]
MAVYKNSSVTMEDEYNQKTESLFELATILGQQDDFQEILRLVTSKASVLFNAEIASILMVNPDTQNTIKTIVREGDVIQGQRCKLVQTNVMGWVSKNRQSFLTDDIRKDARFKKNLFEDCTVGSVMCVPLHSQGSSIGYLIVFGRSEGKEFDSKALCLFEKFATIVAPFLSNVQKIQEYFNAPLPEAALLAKYEPLGLLGRSRQFIELLRAIDAAARCDVRVLLEGQSGTGKELIARAIHQLSSRKQYPFVALDCGAIPENLIESELFGHVRGAFTGALHDRKGLFDEANHGTLFMDEAGNLPQSMQAKLLRVLQESEIRPVGSNRPHKVDVRIISASSTALSDMVDARKFREDLYYRLHVYPIKIPTLNERQDDIPLLAHFFLTKFAHQQQKKLAAFHKSLLNFMKFRHWTGNIRELENFVERLVTLASPQMTTLDHDILPAEFQEEYIELTKRRQFPSVQKSLQADLAEHEAQLIRGTLIENGWNQSKAARALKISERTMRYKMERLGIRRPD